MKILKRFLICIAVLLLVVWTVVLAVNLRVVHKGKAHVWNESSDTAYDAIVVLGAGLRPDGTPSDMLRDRLDGAIALYDAGASDTILLTGDRSGEDYDEVGAMAAYCIAAKIPKTALVCDGEGYSTYESMDRAIRVFGYHHIVVVTQEYHLYRALYVAHALGADADGFASDYHVYRGQSLRNLREYAARVKDFFLTVSN